MARTVQFGDCDDEVKSVKSRFSGHKSFGKFRQEWLARTVQFGDCDDEVKSVRKDFSSIVPYTVFMFTIHARKIA